MRKSVSVMICSYCKRSNTVKEIKEHEDDIHKTEML